MLFQCLRFVQPTFVRAHFAYKRLERIISLRPFSISHSLHLRRHTVIHLFRSPTRNALTHTHTHSHDLLSLERPVCDCRIICGFINFLWPLPLAAMPSPHRCRKLCAVRCALLLLLLWLLCWVYQISNGANCCSQPLSGLSDLLFFS